MGEKIGQGGGGGRRMKERDPMERRGLISVLVVVARWLLNFGRVRIIVESTDMTQSILKRREEKRREELVV